MDMEEVDWQTEEVQTGHAVFRFAETQVGAVTQVVEPIHAESPQDWLTQQFSAQPDLFAVPIERDGGVVGLYPRARLGQKSGFFQAATLDRDLPPHGTIDAREPVNKVVARLFADLRGTLTENFLVYHNGHYFGIADLRGLVARSTLLREQDLNRARELQEGTVDRSRLPTTDWERARYLKMAYEVGGDFYEELAWSDGTCLLSCFDVSGKGVSGSLVTSAIGGWLSAIRALGGRAPDSLTFCRQLNDFLVETLPLGTFVTGILFFLPAKISTGARMQTFNFGYASVYFQVRKENKVTGKVFKPNLPPLGIDGLVLDAQSAFLVPLETGLKVSTFSDGLMDLVNPSGQRYGEQSIRDFLGRSYRWTRGEFLSNLKAEIASFQKDAPQPDDITILTVAF